MKKTSRSFKFLIVSCIVFLCATIGFVLNVSLPNTFRVSAFTLGVKNSLSNSDVENFGDAVAAMNSQYPIEDNDLVFFHKEKNLTQNQDGDFIVNKQTFANLTNTSFEIISENATTNQMRSCAVDAYYLEELAAQNSYEVTHGENNIILTRKYATRRLVLETTNPNFDRCGAVAVANINNLYILQYASIEETKAAYEYYLNQSCINYVEVDIICWVEDEECKESEVMPAGLGDSYSYKTWGAEAMGVPAYSEYLRSLVDADNTDYDLPEVVVAVLDTGIDTDHPWFTDRLLYDGNGKIIGKDYTNVHPDEEYDFEDEHSHGTHCSGIICDMTLSNVKILPLKFMAKKSDGTSSGSGSGAISAMYYTMQLKEQGYNVVAINMSFSSKQNDNFYKDIIKYLYDADIMPVAASGNDGHDASNNSPANVKTSITVSAICRDLTLASFSNFGSLIDVCAPGVSINSANNDGGIVGKQGTSMAAPHVAAYIALLKSDPTHEYSKSDIMNILYGKYNGIQTVLDLGDAGKDDSFGYGLPILNHLVPEYLAVEIVSNGHGTVSALGKNFYQKNNSAIKIYLTPDKNCHVSGIYLDGSLLPYTRFTEEYNLTSLSGVHHLRVEFATKYTVNHFLEPIYELNNLSEIPDVSEYKLIKSEIYYSQFDIETKATSHEYTGFTPIEFEQQIVKDDTVINIYYKRNKYLLTVNIPETGFENITGSGEYLYGQEIDLNPVLQKNFEIESWDIEYCEDVDFLNSLDLHQNQTFSMPASDFTITAKLKHHYVDWIGMATWGGVIFIGVVIIMFITRPRIK